MTNIMSNDDRLFVLTFLARQPLRSNFLTFFTMVCECFDRILDPDQGSACIKSSRRQHQATWILLYLTWVSWVFAIIAVQHCSFVNISDSEDDSLQGNGFFSQAYYGENRGDDRLGCIQYRADTTTWSAMFEGSRAFGVLVALISTVVLVLENLMVLFIQAHARRRAFHLILRSFIPFAFVSSILTLAVFGMEECEEDGIQCTPGAAGVVAILNMFILGVMSFLILLTSTPRQPVFIPFANTITGADTHVSPEDQSGVRRSLPFPNVFKKQALPKAIEIPLETSLPTSTFDRWASDAGSGTTNIIEVTNPSEGISQPQLAQVAPIDNVKESQSRLPARTTPRSPRSPRYPRPLRSHRPASSVTSTQTSGTPRSLPRSPQPLLGRRSPRSPRSSSSSSPPLRTKSLDRDDMMAARKYVRAPLLIKPPYEKTVDVQVDWIPAGRRTVTTVTHPDGSKTIMCNIEETSAEEIRERAMRKRDVV